MWKVWISLGLCMFAFVLVLYAFSSIPVPQSTDVTIRTEYMQQLNSVIIPPALILALAALSVGLATEEYLKKEKLVSRG